jgi:DNA-binding NarL/FixJ family response regulator
MVPAVESASRRCKPVLAAGRATGEVVEVPLFNPARWRQLIAYLGLTPRQSEIAQLICQGHAYKAIARQTGISINTVRMHMRALFPKLGAHDRLSVVLRMIATDRLLRREARFREAVT